MEEISGISGALMSAIAAQGVVIGVLWRRLEKGLEELTEEHRRCEDQLQAIMLRLAEVAIPQHDRRNQVIVEVPNPGRRKGDI